MCLSNLKRKSFIFTILALILLLGRPTPAKAIGGRRRALGRTGASGGAEFIGGESCGKKTKEILWLSAPVSNLKKKSLSGERQDKVPDHNPSLANDGQGNIYLVWEHGNELFWAINRQGKWARSGKIPGDGGNRPILLCLSQSMKGSESADQNTSADQKRSASLFCAWESLTAPKKIISSEGTLTEDGGISWSRPQDLTSDSHDDYGIALTTDQGGHPLVLWLQRASFEDDADLYYQVIGSGSSLPLNGDGDRGQAMAPLSGRLPVSEAASATGTQAAAARQVAENHLLVLAQASASREQAPPQGSHLTEAVDAHRVGKAAPRSEDARSKGDGAALDEPPSNWVGQMAEDPLDLIGPIPPYAPLGCVEIALSSFTVNLPPAIPVFGNSVDVKVSSFLCGNLGLTPRDPSPVLTPHALGELTAELTLGPHLSLGFNLFSSNQAAISTDPASLGEVQQTIAAWGGSDTFLCLSHPYPLVVCGDRLATVRIGIAGSAGIAYNYIRRPKSLEKPRESVTQFAVGLGPQEVFNALEDRFQGFILLAGSYSINHSFSAQGSSVDWIPSLSLSGAVRFGGDWAGLVGRFNKSYTLEELGGRWQDPNTSLGGSGTARRRHYPRGSRWWADPNSSYFKNLKRTNPSPKSLAVQSRKDSLTKTITQIMADGKTMVDEMLELVKEPLVGCGAVYEGKSVLRDISSDIYNDGLPALARSQSGEVMVVWAKALAASSLGSKIYAATYTAEAGWLSPVEITREVEFHHHPALVFDSFGNPMAVWSSSSNDGLDYERSSVEEIAQALSKSNLLYSQRIEGEWTEPAPVAELSGINEEVALAAGPDGEIAAVWINRSGKGFCVFGSLWNGSQWSSPRIISRAAWAESPVLTYAADRKPLVVWAQDQDARVESADDWILYTARWDGTSWHCQKMLCSKN